MAELNRLNVEYEVVEIMSSMANFKRFLKFRDHHTAFTNAKANGYIGMPALLLADDQVILDLSELKDIFGSRLRNKKMKLWHSTTSPFVRKVMAVIKHHQLDEQIELQTIQATFDPNSPHNQDNPLGRVPALQLDNGEWLYNGQVIAEYLDHLGENGQPEKLLLPRNSQRWQVLQLHALTDGIMENTLPVISERLLRPENEWWTSRHQQLTERNIRSFKALEHYLESFGDELNLGTISAVCVIDWYVMRAEKLGVNLKEITPHLVGRKNECKISSLGENSAEVGVSGQMFRKICKMKPYSKSLKAFSQKLRSNQTEAERKLWQRINRDQLLGFRFNRQKPLLNYIVDFCCSKAKLIIELDGSQHLNLIIRKKIICEMGN